MPPSHFCLPSHVTMPRIGPVVKAAQNIFQSVPLAFSHADGSKCGRCLLDFGDHSFKWFLLRLPPPPPFSSFILIFYHLLSCVSVAPTFSQFLRASHGKNTRPRLTHKQLTFNFYILWHSYNEFWSNTHEEKKIVQVMI